MILHDFGNVPWKSFMEWVQDWPTQYYKWITHDDEGLPSTESVIVVCEDFILRKSAEWTPTPVTKQIGVCYGKAYDLGWHFTVQQPMIKPAGYRMAKYKGTPTHWTDAYVHAVYAIHQGVDPEAKIIW
jgi:hypothetical protein